MNFALFDELLERSLEEHRRECLYAGIVAAELWNSSPYRGERPKWISPTEFVPKEKKIDRVQTLDEQIKVLTQVMRCGPGVN